MHDQTLGGPYRGWGKTMDAMEEQNNRKQYKQPGSAHTLPKLRKKWTAGTIPYSRRMRQTKKPVQDGV